MNAFLFLLWPGLIFLLCPRINSRLSSEKAVVYFRKVLFLGISLLLSKFDGSAHQNFSKFLYLDIEFEDVIFLLLTSSFAPLMYSFITELS